MFITLCLLLTWLETTELSNRYHVVDFFAGEAYVAKAARHIHMDSAALDLDYDPTRNSMDINSDAGFALLY